MDYSKLSDRDIDAMVLQQIYGNQASDKDIMRSWLRGRFKYTTNPADAWPIIQENRISIYPQADYEGSKWLSSCIDSELEMEISDENPLRAAMIVFLLMKENQNA
ncbi:phage protein NinX family protein [Cronobacter dublinensis]